MCIKRHDKRNTLPATKDYCVWADCNRRVYQIVRAGSPQEAHRIASENPDDWVFCSDHEDNGYRVSAEVWVEKTGEFIDVGSGPDGTSNSSLGLRQASQRLYDAIQAYLIDLPDSALPEGLVQAFDTMEDAWRMADGCSTENEEPA